MANSFLALVHSSTDVHPAASTNILALGAGAIAVYNESNTPVTAAATAPVRFIQGVNLGELQRVTPLIKPKSVISITKRVHNARTSQVSTIGFNGSAGALLVVNNSNYGVKFINLTQGYEPFPRVASWYKTDSNATQMEIASNWYLNLLSNPDFFNSYFINLMVNKTSTAISASATLNVTNGSKIVIASDAGHDVRVGDYLRIGHATAVTAAVYQVDAVNGTTILLKNEFAGTTASTVAAGVVSSITNEAAGIRVTAKNNVDAFQVALDGEAYGSNYYLTTAFVAPSGTTAQVRNLEQLMASYSGQIQKMILPQTFTSYVPDNTTYILYNFTVKAEFNSGNAVTGISSSDTYNVSLAIRSLRTVTALEEILNSLRADGVASI